MAGKKNQENGQFGRVLSDLSLAVPSADNEGREPSLTPEGAIWVRDVGGSGGGGSYLVKYNGASPGAVDQQLVYTGPCDLLEFFGFKIGAGLCYLQIFDAVALPANGEVPRISIPLLATDNSVFSVSFPPIPLALAPMFSTGVFMAISSTPATLTVAAGPPDVFYTYLIAITAP